MQSSTSIEPCAPQFTLSEVVDTFLIQKGVQGKKYYPAYLNAAYRAWKDLYSNILWVVSSQWKPLKKGEPYNYIEMPRGVAKFLTVNIMDDCGNIVSLYYNQQLNVEPEPEESTCGNGCGSCGCDGGLCEDTNSTLLTEKVEFIISGVEYKSKQWVKYCKDGTIVEYTEMPVKSWNDRIGNAGDYNDDFNVDFLIGQPGAFDNFTVVYVNSQRIICKLAVKPCGCPEDTEENATALSTYCGCYLNPCRKKKRCYPIFQDPNSNHFGSVKISPCGTKVYYDPPPKNYCHKNFKMPTHLQVSYQLSGNTPSAEIIVPDIAQTAVWNGIDFYTKVFNNKYTPYEKKEAEYRWEDAKIQLIYANNPVRLSQLLNAGDTVIRW